MKKLLGILIILITIAPKVYAQSAILQMPTNEKLKMRSAIELAPKNPVKSSLEFEIPKQLDFLDSYTPDVEEIIYKESEKEFNALNPSKADSNANSYPGMRGPNQLIIYTPFFGERTGTNEFGTEAIVENNMVVRLNGADSIIPQNGFVISGHGKAKNWITQNIQLGSKVYIDYYNKSIKVYLTPDSLVYAAKQKIQEVNTMMDFYKKIDVLYNGKRANDFLEKAKESLRKAEKKPDKAQNYISESMTYLDSAIQNAIPYVNKELKGVWVRPTETSPSEIEKTIEKIHSAGITDIFLETYFHGKTIYPSKFLKKCGVISQRQEFVGFDPLEVWIREAHKRNMKVHIWFETFYVGNDNPQTTPNHVLQIYPNWSNKRLENYTSENPVSSLSEHNGYFLDPANPQVVDYVQGILREIVTYYKPDGINLDYIRYPQSVDISYSNYANSNWGYTEYARNEFKNTYGIDPVDIQYGTPEWDTWSVYRQNKISSFVKDIRTLTKQNSVMLTTVIFPDLKKSLRTKMQNWSFWSANNYIDGFTPLILTGDKNTAELLIRDVVKNSSPSTKIYPGLFVTFMGGEPEDLLIQIHKTREYKTQGSIMFDYAHLQEKYIDAVSTRVFNPDYDDRIYQMKPSPSFSAIKDNKKKLFRRKNNDNNSFY